MSGSSDRPLEEEFISPPHSDSEMATDELSQDTVSVALFAPQGSNEKRFVNLLRRFKFEEVDLDKAHDEIKDLLKRIFDHLDHKFDQAAFTFVDKSTRFLLLPHLYHHVTIDLASYPYNIIPVTRLLSLQNAGRSYIKRVTFDGSSFMDGTEPPAGFTNLLSMVIETMPEYQLEYLDWPADLHMPERLTLRLFDRQDEIQNIQLYNKTLTLRGKERKKTIQSLTNLSSLRLSPDDPSGLRHAHHIIKQYTRQLKVLHLDLRTYVPKQTLIDYTHPLADGEDVVQTIFQHASPLMHCHYKNQLSLTKLVLWNANLYSASESWGKLIRMMNLRELEISRCAWAGNFLILLPKIQQRLISLKIHHDDSLDDKDKAPANDKHDLNFDKALSNFLIDLAKQKAILAGPPIPKGTPLPRPRPNKDLPHRVHKPFNHLSILQIHMQCPYEYLAIHDEADFIRFAPNLSIFSMDFLATDLFGTLTDYEVMVEILNTCSPTVLRQLCIPYTAFHHEDLDLSRLNPVTLVLFTWSAGSAQHDAQRALEKLRFVHGDNTRLRIFALKIYQEGCEKSKVEYFVRCEAVIGGRKREIMASVEYADVAKLKEVEILKPTPRVLGSEGRF